jgi:hypothetical protein
MFKGGQPRQVPSVVVLLGPGSTTPMLPNDKGVALLRKSVPPKAPPATPTAATATTPTPAPAPTTGTTTTPTGR